jgi:hypothetical protein
MLSPASGPAVLHQDDDVVSLYVQTALSLWKSNLDGLALLHIEHLTLVKCAKSTYVRYIYKRLTTLAPTNEESSWLNEEKHLIGPKK